jgi:HPt (histidine-containing phosphotransfer) domain-containing protein
MSASQATDLVDALAELPPDTAELAHKLKGSARAIGAFRVAGAVENLELVMRDGVDPSWFMATLIDAVAEARAAIDEMLRRA